jgi:dipeptidyl aminopeptidase/acylaminoacyl peptidase
MTGMVPQTAGFDDGCAFSIGQEPVKVSAIVDFFGPTDVRPFLDGPNRQSWAVEWFAGVEDPAALARRVSPLTYVRPGLPPTIIVHGTRDDAVPYQQSVRLQQAFDSSGVPNELVTIENGGHGSYPDSEKLRAQAEIFRFLEKHGILEKRQ